MGLLPVMGGVLGVVIQAVVPSQPVGPAVPMFGLLNSNGWFIAIVILLGLTTVASGLSLLTGQMRAVASATIILIGWAVVSVGFGAYMALEVAIKSVSAIVGGVMGVSVILAALTWAAPAVWVLVILRRDKDFRRK
jgi:hypothetical protein